MSEFVSNVLIEADMLIDSDIGVIRLINDLYCDKSIFFKSVTNMESNKLKGLLKNRTMSNPLQVAVRDEADTELMDSIYNQFMENEYNAIMERSVLTSIFELLINFMATDGLIVPTIVFKNIKQEEVLNILLDNYKGKYHIVCDKDQLFDVSQYSEIFVKDIRNLVRYKNLHGKTIFLADILMNTDIEKYNGSGTLQPPEPFIEIYMTRNKIKYISLYKYDDSYFMSTINTGRVRDVNPNIEIGLDDPFIQQILGKINSEDILGHYNNKGDKENDKNE